MTHDGEAVKRKLLAPHPIAPHAIAPHAIAPHPITPHPIAPHLLYRIYCTASSRSTAIGETRRRATKPPRPLSHVGSGTQSQPKSSEDTQEQHSPARRLPQLALPLPPPPLAPDLPQQHPQPGPSELSRLQSRVPARYGVFAATPENSKTDPPTFRDGDSMEKKRSDNTHTHLMEHDVWGRVSAKWRVSAKCEAQKRTGRNAATRTLLRGGGVFLFASGGRRR